MRRCLCLAFLSLLVAISAFATVAGDWSGAYTGVANGCSPVVPHGGSTSLHLTQSGDNVSGAISVEVWIFDCTAGPPETVSVNLSGTVSGDTFQASGNAPIGTVNVSGVVTGSTMQLAVEAGDVSGLAWLALSSAPPANFAGTWSGGYSAVATACSPHQPETGAISITASQSGSSVSGTISLPNVPVDCGSSTQNLSIPFSASANGAAFTSSISGMGLSGRAVGALDTSGVLYLSFLLGDTSGLAVLAQGGAGAPSIVFFTADPPTITAGASSLLTWATMNATSVSIDQGVGPQAPSGSVLVTPSATTTYTLTAIGPGGVATATATVAIASALTPNVTISRLPHGMVQQSSGATASDSYVLTNNGTGPAQLTLTQEGSFFTQSPSAITIGAGTSEIISLRAASSLAANFYEGAAIVSGSGVPASGLRIPVRLLVAQPPSGSTHARAVGTPPQILAPATTTNPSGTATFSNSGTATINALVVSDVPWIVPVTKFVSIPPGETRAISFTIDRTQRPDADALIGGAAGSLSLVFLTGSDASFASVGPLVQTTVATTVVSVTIVDVVQPSVSNGSPLSVGPGELALFVPGVNSIAQTASDLLLGTSLGNSSASNLSVYFANSSASKLLNIAQLSTQSPVTFPGVVSTAFGLAGSTGTLQLRGSDSNKVSLAVLQVNKASAAESFATALPVFRSDRGVSSTGRIYLGGFAGSGDLYVQEVSGNTAAVKTEFFAANGTPVGTTHNDTIAPFAVLHLTGAIPSTATTVRITNTSSSSAKIAAYGAVTDVASSDTAVVTDNGSAPSLFIPLIASPRKSSNTNNWWVVNTSSAPINATISVTRSSGRRRSARSASGSTSSSLFRAAQWRTDTDSSSIAAMNILSGSEANGAGYVRIDGPAGSFAAGGRHTISDGTRTFGAGLPAIPSTRALAVGQSITFTGVDDAAAASVNAQRAGAYRVDAGLIEAGGGDAVVRVSVRYTFAAGGKATAYGGASKTVSLRANSIVTLNDLARSVIGAERDTFGDLQNMQIDFEVIGGSGKVIPFLDSIDSSTGDVVVRAD